RTEPQVAAERLAQHLLPLLPLLVRQHPQHLLVHLGRLTAPRARSKAPRTLVPVAAPPDSPALPPVLALLAPGAAPARGRPPAAGPRAAPPRPALAPRPAEPLEARLAQRRGQQGEDPPLLRLAQPQRRHRLRVEQGVPATRLADQLQQPPGLLGAQHAV